MHLYLFSDILLVTKPKGKKKRVELNIDLKTTRVLPNSEPNCISLMALDGKHDLAFEVKPFPSV